MSARPRRGLLAAALVAAVCLPACRARALGSQRPPDTTHLHVLMINGGATRAQNYQSHFLHLERLLALLKRAGVPRERITVFDADGPDPATDMAVREVQPEADFWLLRGTRLEQELATPIVYANSALPGVKLAAATRAGLKSWFRTARSRLGAGDTLLVYVTDHGSKNSDDTSNNRITLWGEKESISVSELKELLTLLDPRVRVVALMSQCYSGAFAGLMSVHARGGLPGGAVCGYFSSTPDRPAYGCYPENRGKANVGHSFHFLDALERSASFAQAHAEVLFTDHTPDVPIRTSDVFLEELLTRAARAGGQERSVLVDALLHEAWRDKAAWEPEIRLLDRIAHAYGFFSPRSLAELEEETKTLPDLAEQLKNHGTAWQAALGDLDAANLDRFVAARPDWKPRLEPAALANLAEPGRRAITANLLGELVPFRDEDAATAARLALLRGKGEAASAAAYRMEVRAAAVLRLRAVLTGVAGRVYVAARARPAERAAYEAIRGCEDLRLGSAGSMPTALAAATDPFPPYEDDVQLARQVLPAWMGINFRQADAKTRERLHLPDGAAAVLTVYPDSPAQVAGLEVGDVVLGPPGKPFTEPRQIREWTMLSAIDQPAPLAVRRGEEELRLTLVPKPYPMRLPELPGPPRIGSAAPSLSLSAYRGTLPDGLAGGKPHLLFFWATWCAPCKASLPEVLAFERDRDTQVIAITDEPGEQLDSFFAHWQEPFPATVAIDDLRRASQAYAVSETPTFVLVDGAGHVASESTGYTPEKGLGVPGWSWSGGTAGAPRP